MFEVLGVMASGEQKSNAESKNTQEFPVCT
jgi:hypothetical protein